MGWYTVIKTIKGHRYLYEQRTWREGKKVRTESRYLRQADGPAWRGKDELSQKPAKQTARVNTTPTLPTELNPATVEEAFADLLKPPTVAGKIGSMILPWSKQRDGKSLVTPVKAIEATISRLNPERDSLNKGALYDPQDDFINMPSKTRFIGYFNETATEAYYATFLHELTHWTGHHSRLNRHSMLDFVFPSAYAREELVAEATAMILLRYFGIILKDSSRHAHYFQGYLKEAGNTDEALAYARKEAERAAQYILAVNTTQST